MLRELLPKLLQRTHNHHTKKRIKPNGSLGMNQKLQSGVATLPAAASLYVLYTLECLP